MNKRVKRQLAAFRRACSTSAQYHVSQATLHEQAIREHKRRGYGDGLERVAGLLDQRNKL